MKNAFQIIVARLMAEGGKAPEWVTLFEAGWIDVEDIGKCLVDREAFEMVMANFSRRGNDLVWDYEHQTLKDVKAPASGWTPCPELRWVDGVGIQAKVGWTDEAAGYIEKKEYRYFSPVFLVRNSDRRVMFVHSVALTNAPKTNHLKPILAKLGEALTTAKEEGMDFWKKLFKALGLADGSTEEDVLTAAAKLAKPPEPNTVEVVAKDVLDALELAEGDSVSTVVASIHALKQMPQGMVSKEEFERLRANIAERDAEEIVAKAMADGKITPDQKEWATGYAKRDLEGFRTFVAKATVVVPVDKLPGKKPEADQAALDEATLTVAKMMDVSAEDIKQYGGAEA